MHKQGHAVAAWLARFGSGLFMVVQMIILLDMTQNWNDDWVSKEDERYVWSTAACYAALPIPVTFAWSPAI